MVETILNRKFGPKSNLFSDWRFWQYSGYRLFSGHGLALGLTGLVTVLSFVLLMVGHDQSINTFEQNTHQFQIISALVQQTKTVRIQANHFLVTQQADDFAASEAALAKLLTGFDQTLDASDPALRFNLEMVNDTTVDYFNTFRSLGELILVAHVTAVQQEIIRNLDENGAQLDQQADSILAQTASTLNESEQLMHNDSNRLRLVLLAVIIVLFAISFVGTTNATHRIARDLHTIGQAAQAIASGQFNTQVVLPRDDEIGRLGVAFNRMAESLKTSTQTETAASEQNRRQIMKLAHPRRTSTDCTRASRQRKAAAFQHYTGLRRGTESFEPRARNGPHLFGTCATSRAIRPIRNDDPVARTGPGAVARSAFGRCAIAVLALAL